MPKRIQLRRDTAENWDFHNPRLEAGELGVELDTNKFKLGDGTELYNDLPYYLGLGAQEGALEDAVTEAVAAAQALAEAEATAAAASAAAALVSENNAEAAQIQAATSATSAQNSAEDAAGYLETITEGAISQGTLGARPAPSVGGRLYYATDADQLFYSDGTWWYQLLVANGVNQMKMGTSLLVAENGIDMANNEIVDLAGLDFGTDNMSMSPNQINMALTGKVHNHGSGLGGTIGNEFSYAGERTISDGGDVITNYDLQEYVQWKLDGGIDGFFVGTSIRIINEVQGEITNGNATRLGRLWHFGGMFIWQGTYTVGGTTSFTPGGFGGGAGLLLDMGMDNTSNHEIFVDLWMIHGGNLIKAWANILPGEDTAGILYHSSHNVINPVTTNTPFAWTTGDRISWRVMFETNWGS